MKKRKIICSTDPTKQDNEKLQTAYKALNSSNPLNWEVLPGIPYLGGFIGLKTEEEVEALIQTGKINRYENSKGEPCFLIADVTDAINKDPELNRISFKSYEDKEHSPDNLLYTTGNGNLMTICL